MIHLREDDLAISPMIAMDKRFRGTIFDDSRNREIRFTESENKKSSEKSGDKIVCEEWKDGFEISRFELPNVKDVYINNVIGNPSFGSDGCV